MGFPDVLDMSVRGKRSLMKLTLYGNHFQSARVHIIRVFDDPWEVGGTSLYRWRV